MIDRILRPVFRTVEATGQVADFFWHRRTATRLEARARFWVGKAVSSKQRGWIRAAERQKQRARRFLAEAGWGEIRIREMFWGAGL